MGFNHPEELCLSTGQQRRVVFFDLDGTLHQQDMFGTFLRYLLWCHPLNLLLVIPLLPIVGLWLLVKGRASRGSVSLLLWAITVGHSETNIQRKEKQFAKWFRQRVTAFPVVQQRLTDYLDSPDADVWLITGSPQPLVEQVYFDAPFMPKVKLIGSQMSRRYGGRVMAMRCLGHEKVAQLEGKLGTPLQLYSGYSDSKQDNPLLFFCQHRWRVTPHGELQQLE
ncbi:phosphatidylglycerophosphatase C [Erwinia tracheiphila]|uniref:phosphatidylglycerophosphatase C n=1 Tax=Erwinia tracheiphila TaxID=65700 RepID=UPI000AFF0AC3|nr:phosphatidylglycerophosphatase C [Erwinia tracheiphila]UIA90036.1 phosphatidylglycerophosphatase C [Erwinia tracheiphila]UIA98563.1 phosphatidylglycerophosphatase C [Erwinia tracheiphila]